MDASANSSVNPVTREVHELRLLFEISRHLDSALDLTAVLGPVLETVVERMGNLRGALALLNRETGDITIEAAHGLTEAERRRGRYRLGEGITGQVVATGEPRIVHRVGDHPDFLNRTRSRGTGRDDLSFVCVPLKAGNETMGALCIDRPYRQPSTLEADVRLLSIIASMIAQAVRLRQQAAEEHQRLVDENARLQRDLSSHYRPANMIGHAGSMCRVYELIAQVAPTTTTVLLRGESGTGKELVAHAIHYGSPRAGKPFVRVNCAALPETVIESELFGHERGAFTGATHRRTGRFELAHGGTIFLDEIGDLSMAMQVRLLRVLQEREFERVGGTETLRTDVRVVAATNRNLEALLEREAFRADLYYRLNVFPIHVPPLRERRADIPLLADYFVEKFNRAHGKTIRRISTPAIDMLMAYHWPGNVRELENCIERALLLSRDDVIHSHHLPPTLQTAEASGTGLRGTLKSTLEAVERELILDALKSSRGVMSRAARALGISERVMGLRVRRYGIDPKRFRRSSGEWAGTS